MTQSRSGGVTFKLPAGSDSITRAKFSDLSFGLGAANAEGLARLARLARVFARFHLVPVVAAAFPFAALVAALEPDFLLMIAVHVLLLTGQAAGPSDRLTPAHSVPSARVRDDRMRLKPA